MAAITTRSPGRWLASRACLLSIATSSMRIAASGTQLSLHRLRIFHREEGMATGWKEVAAGRVGMGWTGSIMARDPTKAGLGVAGLGRGRDVKPSEQFALPAVRDELRFSRRLDLIQDPQMET